MANKKSKKSSALDKAKKLASKSKKTVAKKQSYPSGQNAPQSKKYTQAADKTISAKPTGYRWTTEGAKKLGKNPANRPSISDIEKYAGKTFKVAKKPNPMSEDGSYRFLYLERRADKADLVRKNKLAQGAELIEGSESGFDFPNDSAFKRGGVSQTEPQNWSGNYNEFRDMQRDAKPVGYRYTHRLAKRLRVNPLSKPSAAHIQKYLGKGVYWETRLDKSDRTKRLQDGGVMVDLTTGVNADPRFDIQSPDFMKRGGVSQTEPQNWSGKYNEFRDMQRDAKPVGYRYTGQLAKRLRVNPLSKPSAAHIQKYLGKGVYWETRLDKSDKSRKAKFSDGGVMMETSIKGGEGLAEFARGGASRISNAESRTYTENHLPFKANNLEGKLLENGDYVVLSYGYYPIWFWNKKENKWYGNTNKYSVTTAKHISQSRPTYTAEMVTREELEKLMLDGQEKHMKEWGGELSAPDFQ